MPKYEVEVAREGDDVNKYKTTITAANNAEAKRVALSGWQAGMEVLHCVKLDEDDADTEERDENGLTAEQAEKLEAAVNAEVERRVAEALEAAENERIASEQAAADEKAEADAAAKKAEEDAAAAPAKSAAKPTAAK